MHLLVNKEAIVNAIEKEMELLQRTMDDEQNIRKQLVCSRIQRQKNDWGCQHVNCECGVEYTRSNKCRHVTTKKHQEWELKSTLN
jgi:hypothetical protein